MKFLAILFVLNSIGTTFSFVTFRNGALQVNAPGTSVEVGNGRVDVNSAGNQVAVDTADNSVDINAAGNTLSGGDLSGRLPSALRGLFGGN